MRPDGTNRSRSRMFLDFTAPATVPAAGALAGLVSAGLLLLAALAIGRR